MGEKPFFFSIENIYCNNSKTEHPFKRKFVLHGYVAIMFGPFSKVVSISGVATLNTDGVSDTAPQTSD